MARRTSIYSCSRNSSTRWSINAKFTHTRTGLKLHVLNEVDGDDYDRDHRIKLIQRTIAVLQAGIGSLAATKGGELFEFWVEVYVFHALPPHQWASEDGGLLHPEDFVWLDCEEFGLAPTTFGAQR
jgi:hypothetical protein